MKHGIISAAALLLCMTFSAGCGTETGSAHPEKVSLARNSVPSAKIVVAKDADKAARFAAEELRHCLNAVTGGDFRIATDEEPATGFEILVGESSRTDLKKKMFASQEYIVRVRPDSILLMGADKTDKTAFELKYGDGTVSGSGWPDLFDEQGTMYAVYDFLEEFCGVKFLEPSSVGTVFPKAPDLAVRTAEKRTKPFVAYRGGTFEYAFDGLLLWRQGSEGAKRWSAEAFRDPSAEKEMNRIFFLRRKAGGEFAPANHSFYSYYERFLLKDHKNFESYHPEYFAQGYSGEPPQLCYSNPEVVEQVVKDIRDYFDNGGYRKHFRNVGRLGFIWGENRFALEPMDNSSFCKCPECSKLYEPNRKDDSSEHSTYWFRFVNKVAKEIAKSHPGKKISTLAYMSHEGLPKDIRLEPNIVLYFCISANRTPYSDLLEKQISRMKEWHAAYPDQPIAMWLYNTFPKEIAENGKFNCFPGFFAHETDRQFKIFRALNANAGIFHCGFNGDVDDYIHLRYMCDPNPNADELLGEYFSQYGKAGKPLREFYELVEKRYCDPANYPAGSVHQNVELAWGVLGTPEVMKKLNSLMTEAENLAETDLEKKRVRLWRLGVRDFMKEGFDSYTSRANAPTPKWTAKKVADAEGNPDRVSWKDLPAAKTRFFIRGGDKSAGPEVSMRFAHDGKYLYFELTEILSPKKLVVSPAIAPYDTWEFFVSAQNALPYRQYISGADGRMEANSNGEVNFRMGVPAAESGDAAYGAKMVSDRSAPDRWVARYAFPLSGMLDVPLKPGSGICLNLARVTSPGLYGDPGLAIYTAVSHTTVHTVDRGGSLTLEK